MNPLNDDSRPGRPEEQRRLDAEIAELFSPLHDEEDPDGDEEPVSAARRWSLEEEVPADDDLPIAEELRELGRSYRQLQGPEPPRPYRELAAEPGTEWKLVAHTLLEREPPAPAEAPSALLKTAVVGLTALVALLGLLVITV